MDPITVTTTFITLATFIKDLIEVGESIHSSIEKVSENRRQIRELMEDVVRTLYELANLTRGHEETFQGPELLRALEILKAEMLHVQSKCCKITLVQLPGFWRIGSEFRAWRKRNDLAARIEHLKQHVRECFLKFTVEQRLIVNNVENQVKARRLEGMMAQLLLETQFGQNVLNQTIEKISSDPTHKTLESQYLSTQTTCLIDSLQKLLISGNLCSCSLHLGRSFMRSSV
ncbi:hypothetical protein K438DRAFT_1857444 [Mycena galopus ATCC 62051]|nr:hypothetical protein K438DRAFT_1857444 [Mycena galopus ATCC 62051]